MSSMNVLQLTERCRAITIPEPSTYQNWLKAIKPIAYLPVSDIDKSVVMNYRINQRKPNGPLSDNTFKQRVGYLKGIWNTAIDLDGQKIDNPWKGADKKLKNVKKRRRPQLLPWEFYECYHNHPRFRCLWFHGFRINELVGIYKVNVVMDAPIPYFNLEHQANRRLKNDSSIRQIPIHPECYSDIENLKFGRKPAAGWKWGQEFRHKLCLPPGDASHSLRHSFKSRMNLAEIINPVQKALMGHEPSNADENYGEVTLEMKLNALKKLR